MEQRAIAIIQQQQQNTPYCKHKTGAPGTNKKTYKAFQILP